MDAAAHRALLRRVAALEAGAVRARTGEVTDDSPLSISLGSGDPIVGARAIEGQTFTPGDLVLCLSWRGDLIVLGVIE